ncbi:hypothetical protein K439DRAFT_214617 [Ramaria rubella]|nr:hypothetical protein K439DRAFT_214617 [Ramaria rubella]
MSVEETTDELQQPLFTCMSCSIGFLTAEDQRVHYRSDHHRYNMKRRVASLPPISASMFNQKVLQRRAETAVTTSPKGAICEVCNKIYTTENAYRSHITSKKHKDNEAKATTKAMVSSTPVADPEPMVEFTRDKTSSVSPRPGHSGLTVDVDADQDDINETIDSKIAAARSRLTPNSCLFCPHQSLSIEDSLSHMAIVHSFFIPDVEYLQDLRGLLTYLGEKVAVGNVCLFCNGKGREFRTIEAVWKHMNDKGHCKIAYDEEKDRLDISDFYDFSSSYPDAVMQGKKQTKSKPRVEETEEQDWEDMDDDGEEVDEIIDEEGSSNDDNVDFPESQITYGDTDYELVLPSGARIGHRSMRRYYAQSFSSSRVAQEDPKSGAAIVRRLLADKRSDLVPVKGGFGAFGSGTQVIKARNRGEAKEAGRHIREFRDQKRKEDYKTRVAFVHNYQKHFRDPLLQ